MTEMQDFLEQLDASKAVVSHYDCFICQQFEAIEPVVIVQDLPEGGVRAAIVGVCISCKEELK